MLRVLLSLFAVGFALAANPVPPQSELIRAAIANARGGDRTTADVKLQQAEEFGDDPGLIAFNRATLAFDRGDFRAAEVDFLRTLDDAAIALPRKAHALYNRGVCLVNRGADTKLLRTAISCFEECLEALPPDDRLAADARHNLELTKLLWNESRAKQSTPPKPDEIYENERPMPQPMEPNRDESSTELNGSSVNSAGSTETKPMSQQVSTPKPMSGTTRSQPTPAAGTTPVVSDTDRLQQLSPDDTNTLLARAESRLQAARKQNEQMRAGPERPHVRDW